MLMCFAFISSWGLRAEGGVADHLIPFWSVSDSDDGNPLVLFEVGRWTYDMVMRPFPLIVTSTYKYYLVIIIPQVVWNSFELGKVELRRSGSFFTILDPVHRNISFEFSIESLSKLVEQRLYIEGLLSYRQHDHP